MTEKKKNSGVDWIGDIPEDWEITKIRYATKTRSEKGYFCPDDKYIGLENISSYTGKYITSESQYDSGMYDIYKKGDILFRECRQ